MMALKLSMVLCAMLALSSAFPQKMDSYMEGKAQQDSKPNSAFMDADSAQVPKIDSTNMESEPDDAEVESFRVSLYPYGSGAGDTALGQADDRVSSRQSIWPFPFCGRTRNSLYINNNGFISFDAPYNAFTPRSFPISGPALIAPYWADADTRGGGNVYFRETTDYSLRRRASAEIHLQCPGFSRSNPGWMATSLYIVTYYRVGYYNRHNDKRNTFQTVLASDGRYSFVMFLYQNIQYTTGDASGGSRGLGGTRARAGFNAGTGGLSFTVPGSGSSAMVNIDQTTNSGPSRIGQWLFRVDATRIFQPAAQQAEVNEVVDEAADAEVDEHMQEEIMVAVKEAMAAQNM